MRSAGRGWLRACALALAVVQLPVLAGSWADPYQSDFVNYYAPATVLSRGGDLGALYERDRFAESASAAGLERLGSFVPHPPANALWLLPFAGFEPKVAKASWTVVLLLALGLTILAVRRLLIDRDPWLAVVIVLAPTLALRNNLAFGQPYLILALLLIAGALALRGGYGFASGFLLGLGVSFKPHALGLGFLFLHRDRLRPLAGFATGALLPSLLVVVLNGTDAFSEFWSKVLPWMARAEIQDPFSPVWGSASALVNRLFRFEADLNPGPWVHIPSMARFLAAAIPLAFVCLGALCGRKALDQGRPMDAVAQGLAFALAASPFGATYHLVLLVLPVAVLAGRLSAAPLWVFLSAWAVVGSPLLHVFRETTGLLTPLAFVRFFVLAGFALFLARPFLTPRIALPALCLGVGAGLGAWLSAPLVEVWPRVEAAKGYSMMKPHFCGTELAWWSPSADGRGLERRGVREACESAPSSMLPEASVVSRFDRGSWNLYLRTEEAATGPVTRLTFSDANEIDPVIAPDGCSVVFASDQGRGLGSTALYRLDLTPFIEACGRGELGAIPR